MSIYAHLDAIALPVLDIFHTEDENALGNQKRLTRKVDDSLLCWLPPPPEGVRKRSERGGGTGIATPSLRDAPSEEGVVSVSG